MLYGKNVVLGVTGCIAAYKACEVVSRLKKLGAEVDVIMTANATEFVTPLTFETLSKREVVTYTFSRGEFDVHHVSLAKKADIFVIAPSTANVIGKLANGVADDMLTTTFLACKAPKLICPAMNTAMYEDAAMQKNLETLKERGVNFVEPESGILACGDCGKGRLAEPSEIVAKIEEILQPVADFKDKTVLVTAGGTEEYIDGVRVITNHSSGKMGFALVKEAAERGAKVVLIKGKTTAETPKEAAEIIDVTSTADMFEAVKNKLDRADVIIMAAAPADYRIKEPFKEKVKSETLTLELVKNPDIAAYVGQHKQDKKLVIFSAETEDLLKYARQKMLKKNADLAVANDVTTPGAGFDVDTNIASLIDRDGNITPSGLVLKTELAKMILDKVSRLK